MCVRTLSQVRGQTQMPRCQFCRAIAGTRIPFSGMPFSHAAVPEGLRHRPSFPEQRNKSTGMTRPAGSSGRPCGRWRRRWCGLCLSGIGFSSPDLQFIAGACMWARLFLQFWGSVGTWDWRFCFCMLSVYCRPVPVQDAASPCRLPPLAQACRRHCREE